MNYKLMGDKDGRLGMIMDFPETMSLKAVKEVVEFLAHKWDDEFHDWTPIPGGNDFVSQYLPGLYEGDDIILETPSGKVLLLTGDNIWEKVK